jgi:hypothetical protein
MLDGYLLLLLFFFLISEEVLDAPLDRPRDEGEDRTNLIVNYLPQVTLTHPPPSNPVANLIFLCF